jgi:cytochrome c5
VAERIKPVGEITVSSQVMDSLIPAANAAGDKGKATYDASCGVCHAAGVAGAPKLGDKAAWKDRIAKGNDALYTNAIKGFQGKVGMMPPKGGNMSLADADVKAAVDHMVNAAK